MDIKLNFFGAAQNVTGSCYLVDVNGSQILVDCGLYQERKLKPRNYAEFPIPADQIDAVLLTHAHLDHCGRLPKLVKEGFKGPIYCSPATAEIAAIILKDSAHLQEEDVKYKLKRHKKQGKTSPFPYEPLYTTADAEATIPLFKHVKYDTPIEVGKGMTACFREAGHIFGSTMIKLTVDSEGESRSILFSGDVGRENLPIIEDPTQFNQADYVLIESTYGDRVHGEVASIPGELERIINETAEAGGNVVIPSFAVERTQELIYHLAGLLREKRIPNLPVFIDSPMAIRVTEIFKKHPELFDDETKALVGGSGLNLPGLKMSMTVDDSKAIAKQQGTSIIIAGSGMCTGGRIKHHLKNNIDRPDSTVLFVGYQAIGTLGRIILDGIEEVRLFGEMYPVKARLEKVSGFSAHADKEELIHWISSLKNAPRKVFVTHGEESAAAAFRDYLEEKTGWDCVVAEYEQEVILD